MPNIALGQRIGRGNVNGERISVVVPKDIIPNIEKLTHQRRTSVSLMLVELIERGLRDLAIKGDRTERGFLTPDEVASIQAQLK